MKLLILDNYDSFTYNLVHLVEKCSDIELEVHRNDKISIRNVNAFDKILLSPGPGLPKEAGILKELIVAYSSTKSILGVCLGQQAIAEVFGAKLKNLERVYHGIATPIKLTNPDSLFTNCPASFEVGRYHSWVVDPNTVPNELEVTAIDDEQNIMALRHKTYNIKAVQFHPESILSEYGETIIRNWISL
ncbi:MAG: aminodeoxychorismate/anthranilate synthase component II [Bacteroidota bacterium]|nr:aminodeoxychorismate/anthranilate synthase component II [Bacteroidota bacterium]